MVPIHSEGRPLATLLLGFAVAPSDESDALSLLRRLAVDLAFAFGRAAHESDMTARAEHSRHESEAELRAIFELAPLGIAQTDPQTRRFLKVNERYCAITGYSAQELLAMTVDDLTHASHRPLTLERYATMLGGGEAPRSIEKQYVRKDGTLLWVSVNATVLRDETGRATRTLAMIEDITDRRRAETTRRLQTTALQSAANGVVITDTNGVIEWANDAFARLTGYDASEVVGRNARILRSSRRSGDLIRSLWQTILAGGVWHGELVNRRKDGTDYHEDMVVTPVRDELGVVTHFVAIKQDITARKEAERALAEAEERQRLALDAGEQGIIVIDIETRIARLDARARLHFGLDTEYAPFDVLRAKVPLIDRPLIDEAIAMVKAPEGPGRAVVEHRVEIEDAGTRWLLAHLRGELRGEGNARAIVRVIATTSDVTLAHRREEELRASEERYRGLVDNLDHVICSTDVEGRIVFINNAVSRFGFHPKDLIGIQIEDFMHVDDRARSARDRAT
ncbi:MAG: PAS domain S-box protein, partial [Polyangiales bacterium]